MFVHIASFASPLGPIDDACRPLISNVCPLFVLKGRNQPHLIGSGVPLQVGGVRLIATAAHVLAPYGRASVLTLGTDHAVVLSGERRGFGYRPGTNVDVDLAIVVLSDEECAKLGERLTFSYAFDFASSGPVGSASFFAVVGCPQSKNKLSPKLQRQGAVVTNWIVSRSQIPVAAVPSADKFAHAHFAVRAESKGAMDVNGAPAPFASPSGMSGGGVWRLFFPPDITGLPQPRLVGIVIEYFRDPGAFVCTRIEHVTAMLEDLIA